MKFRKKQIDEEIGEPPARQTRIRDNIMVPDIETFKAGYKVLHSSLLPSKTKEITFQILNRTLWSTNKAHKAGEADTSHCAYCGQTETTEHMILNCDNYAYPQWEELQHILSDYLTQVHNNMVKTQIEVGERNAPQQDTTIQVTLQHQHIIYHKPLQQLRTYRLPRTTAQVTTLLIAEIKRDIYRRKIQNPPPTIGTVQMIRRLSHLNSMLKKVQEYITYLSPYIWKNDIAALDSTRQKLAQRLILESE